MVAYEVTPWSALMEGVFLAELLDTLVNRPGWHADALCHEYPNVDFFPLRGESAEPAREVCRRCAVRPECITWAMELKPDLHGVWGGTSHVQRKRARVAGLDTDEILHAVDTRTSRDASPSTWETAPCRGCTGLLSRADVERDDGLCWACWPSHVALA